jgi:uncharacterized membrane protein
MAKHPQLALIGLLGAAAPWADKWALWLSPEAQRLPSGLLNFPIYDSAMFIAYLTLVPGIAAFYMSMETDLFIAFRRFFDELLRGATLDRIEARRSALVERVCMACFGLLLLQGLACALALLASPLLVEWNVLTPVQHPVFRFGALGALFHAVVIALLAVMSYLDARRAQMVTLVVFVLANAGAALATRWLWPEALGYGYPVAAAITLAVALALVSWQFRRLPYMVFVANNPCLRD